MRLEARTVTVPALDSVKMEDRKRPAGPDDSAPPSKRQAVPVNGAKSHQDTDLPWKDDLELYQKDAILRQLKEYKREKAMLEAQVADMEKRSKYHDDHLRIIDMWFSQLIDEVKILANDTASLATDVPFPATLLFADSETFKKHLSDRSQKIKLALSDLFSKLPTAAPEVSQVQQQVAGLLALEKEHIAQLHQITTEKEQLADRFDMATHRYMVAEKKMDRMKSVQVRKLEEQAIATSVKEEAPSASEAIEVNGTNGEAPSPEAESSRKEAIAEATKRKSHIEQLEAKNKELTEQVTTLSVKLAGLSDDDYAKTDLFKNIKSQHEDVIKRINHLTATNVSLREEVQKLQADRTAYRMQVEHETRDMLSETEANLVQSEANLTRIRNSRDELIAKVSVLEASQKDSEVSKQQIQELVAAREHRISALESECERIRLKLAELESTERQSRPELDDMSPEQLRSKVADLQNQLNLLSNEVPSMEAAWKKAQAAANKKLTEIVAWEDQVTRANADKAKADQKFFAAMKTKEAREQEVRVLRTQAMKSTEIVAQLKEADSLSRSLVDKHEKQLAEMRSQMEELSVQYRALQQKMTENQILSEGQTKQITELKNTLTAKDTSYLAAAHSQRESEIERDKLKLQVDTLETQVELWKKRSMGNQSEEASQMRSMLQCQICKDAFKDTVIKTCGHVFCNSCVQDRVNNRMRKCPSCAKAFGSNDTMRIHI
ncbi:BRE1-domain-containing protein [Delitschia confertaspora ATCC 74209]|uniref:E3 ubiquitin protein ligase n=1 Tax=Delitschia confertaspora ATCC 74209 TaxID=1513339 RepID=A0A9P4MWJ0_9PLEO|nr:BRE1-domain-containing protein [Delitschia confertaspora ATCC 74209]